MAASHRSGLTRWETIGAWLRIWTPPKGVAVPPVPKRKLAAGTVVVLIVAGAVVAVIAPPIHRGKERRAERAREAHRRLVAAEGRRLARMQRLRSATFAGTSSVGALEAAIARDAGRRVECRRYRAGYSCTAVTASVHPTAMSPGGVLGYPFWARVDRSRRTYYWCRIALRPAEGMTGRELARAALPRDCDLTRDK